MNLSIHLAPASSETHGVWPNCPNRIRASRWLALQAELPRLLRGQVHRGQVVAVHPQRGHAVGDAPHRDPVPGVLLPRGGADGPPVVAANEPWAVNGPRLSQRNRIYAEETTGTVQCGHAP